MIGVVALLGLTLALQSTDAVATPQGAPRTTHVRRPTPPATDTGVVATRAESPVTIDGIDEDAVWREAPPITAFRMWRPTEGGEVRSGFKTEARVAYDAANLYVFVRAYDPHPDSIIKLLERRDSISASDMIWLLID
jgi:hypothetical protein